MLWCYRQLTPAQTVAPVGTPNVRDPEDRCDAYNPNKMKPGQVQECETDGHHLCTFCVLNVHYRHIKCTYCHGDADGCFRCIGHENHPGWTKIKDEARP